MINFHKKNLKLDDENQAFPQIIREYILHDRGNSIFLGDSFANLPSPVGEGQTVKNFFKYNEDDEDKKELKKSNKDDKNEITELLEQIQGV